LQLYPIEAGIQPVQTKEHAMGREFYSDEGMETEVEQERSAYDEMVSRLNETGHHERSLQEIEDRQVAADLLGELTWQEKEGGVSRGVEAQAQSNRGRPEQGCRGRSNHGGV
jgi:hypothetical protein